MNKLIIIRKSIAFIWLFIGGAKVIAALVELIAGIEITSPIMTDLVNHITVDFYRPIGETYYLAYPLFFIGLAGIIEVFSSIGLLKGKLTAKLGLLGFALMTTLYIPFHDGLIAVINILSVLGYLFFLKYPHEENFLKRK